MTPLEEHPELAEAIGVDAIGFKREDLHPYGSHKGRSIPVMIDHYVENGDRRFAISSSGNAALAAGLHIRKLNSVRPDDPISLDIFIGNNAAPTKAAKLKALESENIQVLIRERPLQALTQAAQEGVRSLRQSTDDAALSGYGPLAMELAEHGGIGAVFIGASSGTTAQALAEYFLENEVPIQVHIIQTSSCHPIAEAFEAYDGPEEASEADAIVDKTAYRKDELVPLIESTGGRGWIADNSAIKGAVSMAAEHADLEVSANSALSIAGLMQAAAIGWDIPGMAVCMICGE